MILHVQPGLENTVELVKAESGYSLFLTGWACNTGNNNAKITVYAVGAGESYAAGMELYKDLPLPFNDTFSFTPVHLEEGEALYVATNNPDVVFSVTGQRMAK